jgi:hemerythrin
MALFPWQQRFLIGISEIDEHHIHLVGLLNTAYDDFCRSAAVERLNALFLELIDYATYHFATEERLMAKSSYPGAGEHGRSHQAFAIRVTEMHHDFLTGKPVYLEILTFLKEWLEAHILKADSDLGKFLKAAGK